MAAQAISAGVASSGAGETSTSSLMYNSDQSHFTRNIKLFTMPVCSDRQNSSRLTRVGRQTRSTTWRSLLLACCQTDYARWGNKWWIGSQVSNQYLLNSWTINAWCQQIKMSHSWGLSVVDYCWKVGCGHKRPAPTKKMSLYQIQSAQTGPTQMRLSALSLTLPLLMNDGALMCVIGGINLQWTFRGLSVCRIGATIWHSTTSGAFFMPNVIVYYVFDYEWDKYTLLNHAEQ
jgi:hypothetical protein